jgi:ribosomal protein L18
MEVPGAAFCAGKFTRRLEKKKKMCYNQSANRIVVNIGNAHSYGMITNNTSSADLLSF